MLNAMEKSKLRSALGDPMYPVKSSRQKAVNLVTEMDRLLDAAQAAANVTAAEAAIATELRDGVTQ